MSTDTLFTPSYFRAELIRFREAFGTRAVMLNPAKRDMAFKGFTICYLSTQGTPEEMEECAMLFQSACTEFERRCFLTDIYLPRLQLSCT